MENDVRKYELEQANEQIKMLHSFMPETFLRRGGEKEELERFSYDLEMKTREQNRNNKRTEIE